MRRVVAPVLVPLLFAVASCGDGQEALVGSSLPVVADSTVSTPRTTDSVALAPQATDTRLHPDAELPETRFGYSATEQYLISKALSVLTAECVESESGSKPEMPPSASRKDLQLEAEFSRDMLLFDDPVRAAKDGYYWLPRSSSSTVGQPPPSPLVAETDCTAKSNIALTPSGIALANEPADLAVESAGTVSKIVYGDELADARAAWAECLAKAGYPDREFPIPIKKAERGSGIEVPLAVADVACRESTGLMDAIAKLVSQESDTYASTHDVKSSGSARTAEVGAAVAVLRTRGLLTADDLAALGVAG